MKIVPSLAFRRAFSVEPAQPRALRRRRPYLKHTKFCFSLIVIGLTAAYPGAIYGQPRFEVQVHYSATAGDLGRISGGGVGNILAGFSLPVGRQGKTNLIVKGGFNDYGGSEGFGPLEGQHFKARGIPLLGGVRVYAEAYDSDNYFFEVALGAEIKSGHLRFGADTEEMRSTALLGSAGVGLFFSSGIGFTVSYNVSRGSWHYGNFGLIYRFGG